MSVAVDICSSGLIKLGAMPINDLNDDNKEAKLCKAQYPRIRDSVLRSADWSFALKRVTLTPAVVTLEFSDSEEKVFILPADCVRVSRIVEDRYDYPTKFKLESGRKLITTLDTVNLLYVSNTVPENDYDANFKEAVSNMLAADLCYAITQSTSLKAGLEASADFWIKQARSHNSQEKTPEDFKFDDFLNSRRGGHEIYD